MQVEIKYKQFQVNFDKADIERMALNMQAQLFPHIVSIEQCLNIVSSQFGYTYQQIVKYYEHVEYQTRKSTLIDYWAQKFLLMGFKGWTVSIEYIHEDGIPDNEQVGQVYVHEVFGDDFGVKFDLDDVYKEVWKVVLELLMIENTIAPFIDIQDKDKLEKHILQHVSPESLRATLSQIHSTIEALSIDTKTTLLNQIRFGYLPSEIESMILYQTR